MALSSDVHTTAQEERKQGLRFSVVELLNDFKAQGQTLFTTCADVQLEDIEEALLYLSKIGALKLEGGFLVLYYAMDIRRIKENRFQYKKEDYRMLDEFYRLKIQQVHIVGEYANLMVRDYDAALRYVTDYFQMDYKHFVQKYFKGERATQIEKNLTPEKYAQLFGQLSEKQMQIISDKESRVIVVAAGPGSGKTRVLVHKLASLLLLEDVKHEQLLMLTFSRAAATEFKQRLMELIGNAAHFVEIKTFHSYCFDLLGRIGNLDEAQGVVGRAAQMIAAGEVEPGRISKTVLVIDEAQDMSQEEFELVQALMAANEDMRVIAVGDDDQNIFDFRGSKSQYMAQLLGAAGSIFVEMTENYRSSQHVVAFANAFVLGISDRMKHTPIVSMSAQEGLVSVVHCTSHIMYQRLVADLVQQRGKGTTAVLTQTNEEAVILLALLHKHGIRGKLIQSMDVIRFWNLAEVRFFMKQVQRYTHTSLIPDEVWHEAKKRTQQTYATSASWPYLARCLELFERTSRMKYLTDFKEFLFESSIEDFCDVSDADVVVSTIHKSKGREFDDVYVLISHSGHESDSSLRRYYVGFTRARRRLFVYTCSPLFHRLPAQLRQVDTTPYSLPHEVMLQLTHRDVNLRFFKCRKAQILALRSGEPLSYARHHFYSCTTHQPVAHLSHKMQSQLALWAERGYHVSGATIRFVVAWRPKDAPKDEPEHAVLLLDVMLKKAPDV